MCVRYYFSLIYTVTATLTSNRSFIQRMGNLCVYEDRERFHKTITTLSVVSSILERVQVPRRTRRPGAVYRRLWTVNMFGKSTVPPPEEVKNYHNYY